MNERFERNIGALTGAEQELLGKKRAVVVGCGGLGGYAAEFLARIGLGHLTLVDEDVFAPSNLNRQLHALESNLGEKKAFEVKKRLLQIVSDLSVEVFDISLDSENAGELLKGHDVIIDALDNVKTRLIIEKTANDLGIPLVHGAVEQWNAQVCTVFPGDFTLSKLYKPGSEFERPSVLSFTPAFCASLQAAEAIKILLNRKNILRKKLLTADMLNDTSAIIDL